MSEIEKEAFRGPIKLREQVGKKYFAREVGWSKRPECKLFTEIFLELGQFRKSRIIFVGSLAIILGKEKKFTLLANKM